MSDEDDLYDPEGTRRGRQQASDFQSAVDRFEEAVQDLVGSATSEFSDRATAFLNDTTARLEREFGRSSKSRDYRNIDAASRDAASRMAVRRKARARYRSERILERSARLCRDVENAKIVGVCAGIANYYGVEHWVVRCIAVTGLLFFGQIVFPAYWIMYFVMDSPDEARKKRREARRKKRDRPSRATDPMPELHADVNPRRSLRHVQADLQEVELRLRRMESHVTSGQYELQRELHKIDDGSTASSGSG
jgi:phage shock protein C